MDTIFTYILKVNVLITLFYLVYQLALSKETFYKHSRWFLLSGLFISLLLPFVTFTKIEYYEAKEVLSNSIESNVSHMVQISKEVAQEPILTNLEILFLLYGIICFGFLLKTIFDFVKLFKIIKVSNSEKRDKLIYVNTNLVQTPFSFFNYIVFNEELINPIELQNIIKHEEAHSLQKHSFDTLLAQFFIILFWFNPIVWLYRKSIVQNLEFLADSFAIQQVSDKTMYQKTMLKITLQPQHISIINTFNQSSIKKRIIMLNTNQSQRKNIWKFGIILPFVTAFMLLFQVETIAQEKESKTIKKEIKVNEIIQNENFQSIYNSPYESDTKENLKRVFVINNKVYTKDDLKNKNIAQFNNNGTINKIGPEDAIKLYGKKAKDGAVIFKGDWKIIDNVIEQEKGEIEIFDKVIEVDGFESSENPKYFSIDNMSKNGKEVVLIVNGKIKGATEKMKIPFDEELGEMKEITPSEFEKKYNKSANNDRYYYEVKTVKSKSNEENVKIETEKKELNPLKVEFSFSESDQVDQIDKVKKDKNVDAKKALIILNDKEINFEELEKIDSNLIASVSVMSASTFAMKKFGEKAKNGVIIIQTKELVEKKQKQN